MKSTQRKIGLAVILLLSVLYSQIGMSSDRQNGNACVAANLNQAFELQWNQARVLNPGSNPNTRFVTCAITTGSQFMDHTDGLQFSSVESGSVVAVFMSDSAPGAEVSCVFRELSSTSTGNAGSSTAVINITADDPLPDTNSGSFLAAAGIAITIGSSLTLTCSLPPGTGINTYNATHTYDFGPE